MSISALYEKLFLPNAMSGTSGVVWLAFYSIFRSAFKSSPGRNRLSKAGTFSDLPRFHPSGINGTLTGYANAGKTDPFSPGTGAAPAGCSLSTFSSSVSVRVSRRGAEFQPAHLPSQKSPTSPCPPSSRARPVCHRPHVKRDDSPPTPPPSTPTSSPPPSPFPSRPSILLSRPPPDREAPPPLQAHLTRRPAPLRPNPRAPRLPATARGGSGEADGGPRPPTPPTPPRTSSPRNKGTLVPRRAADPRGGGGEDGGTGTGGGPPGRPGWAGPGRAARGGALRRRRPRRGREPAGHGGGGGAGADGPCPGAAGTERPRRFAGTAAGWARGRSSCSGGGG